MNKYSKKKPRDDNIHLPFPSIKCFLRILKYEAKKHFAIMMLISGRVMVANDLVTFVCELGYWLEIRNFETDCKHGVVFHLPRRYVLCR